ncbi:hypothetical protein CPB83DRAFT_900408 [Crepidotus variabilis]|uniref:Uncharacterized protein n=1 Tax=Crepidotus variabilis TaxID=179855 RepID=A0A9P6E387_9AGAR|nr:hypothetical protein CPB83DRAFT_900408 [Crepidotus variabilis]
MLTEYYLMDQRRAIQCFRASDKPSDESWITSYVKFYKVSTGQLTFDHVYSYQLSNTNSVSAWKVYSCSSSVEATMDQLRVIDQSNADPLNPSSFLFYLNDDMITGEVFDADDALNLRKAESAFFQIVPPWPELRNRQVIGINSLTRALANGRITSPRRTGYCTIITISFFLGLILIFIYNCD